MGRPFRVLIHKPGDLPAVCTEAFASMPRVKLAVRFTYTLSLAISVRLVSVRVLKSEQNVISSLNHVATIATVAGSFAPQGFSGRFILLLKV